VGVRAGEVADGAEVNVGMGGTVGGTAVAVGGADVAVGGGGGGGGATVAVGSGVGDSVGRVVEVTVAAGATVAEGSVVAVSLRIAVGARVGVTMRVGSAVRFPASRVGVAGAGVREEASIVPRNQNPTA